LRKDVITNVILNKLYQQTPLQSSFSVNNQSPCQRQAMMLNLKDIIVNFVAHRMMWLHGDPFELEQAQKRAHIVEGLLIALITSILK